MPDRGNYLQLHKTRNFSYLYPVMMMKEKGLDWSSTSPGRKPTAISAEHNMNIGFFLLKYESSNLNPNFSSSQLIQEDPKFAIISFIA